MLKKGFGKKLIAGAFVVVMAVSAVPMICAAAEEWSWTQGTLNSKLKLGDVDNDTQVDADDVTTSLKVLNGTTKKQDAHVTAGDLGQDGELSVRDALLLLQNLEGIRDDGLGYENALSETQYYIPECFQEDGEMMTSEKALSFYGADGYGKYTTGGRGAQVIEVTNLNADGPGSLKAAAELNEPRIIVFKVYGTIYLKGDISVKGNCTIAGETAPGDGITLANHALRVHSNNVVIRYIRIRPGDQSGEEVDGMDVKGVKDIMVDHCSTSFGVDENLSIAAGSLTTYCDRVTVQWCMIGDSITFSPNNGKRHGMGSIITSADDGQVSYHHNFLYNNSSRNPVVGTIKAGSSADFELANNVIYNWAGGNASKTSTNGEDGVNKHISRIDLLNSYYKQGPNSTGNVLWSQGNMGTRLYLAGNMMDGVMPEDQTGMVQFENEVLQHETNLYWTTSGDYLTPDVLYQDGRLEDSQLVHLQSAEKAMEDVVKYAGASLSRDTFDTAAANSFYNGTGTLIDQTFEADGWTSGTPETNVGTSYYNWIQGKYPILASYPAYVDSDHDGMSDGWEDFMGLDKNDGTDYKDSYKGTEYTNLDVFLQFLVENPEAAIAR